MKRGLPRRKSCPPDFGAVTAAAAQSRPTERMTSPFASSIELNIVLPHRILTRKPADAPVSGRRYGEAGTVRGRVSARAGPFLAARDKSRQRLDGSPSLG